MFESTKVANIYREMSELCEDISDTIHSFNLSTHSFNIYNTDYIIQFKDPNNIIVSEKFALSLLKKAKILTKICKSNWTFYVHYGAACFHFKNREDYLKGLLAIGEKCI